MARVALVIDELYAATREQAPKADVVALDGVIDLNDLVHFAKRKVDEALSDWCDALRGPRETAVEAYLQEQKVQLRAAMAARDNNQTFKRWAKLCGELGGVQ